MLQNPLTNYWNLTNLNETAICLYRLGRADSISELQWKTAAYKVLYEVSRARRGQASNRNLDYGTVTVKLYKLLHAANLCFLRRLPICHAF